MAKRFAGFKPETFEKKILPALGYDGPTDTKSINLFLAANPAADVFWVESTTMPFVAPLIGEGLGVTGVGGLAVTTCGGRSSPGEIEIS